MKEIKVWTAQMGKRHLVAHLGLDFLDITAKSGIAAFAPDYGEVMRYKRGETPESLYTKLYLTKMRRSFREQRAVWEDLKNHDTLVLCCYCPAGKYCHRHLLLAMLDKFFLNEGIELVRMGELITKEDYTASHNQ